MRERDVNPRHHDSKHVLGDGLSAPGLPSPVGRRQLSRHRSDSGRGPGRAGPGRADLALRRIRRAHGDVTHPAKRPHTPREEADLSDVAVHVAAVADVIADRPQYDLVAVGVTVHMERENTGAPADFGSQTMITVALDGCERRSGMRCSLRCNSRPVGRVGTKDSTRPPAYAHGPPTGPHRGRSEGAGATSEGATTYDRTRSSRRRISASHGGGTPASSRLRIR